MYGFGHGICDQGSASNSGTIGKAIGVFGKRCYDVV